MIDKVEAPFTQEQVETLNRYQDLRMVHPFTCCSPEEITECMRRNKGGSNFKENQGILIATIDGWVCPCGEYTQKWAHDFMANKPSVDSLEKRPSFGVL